MGSTLVDRYPTPEAAIAALKHQRTTKLMLVLGGLVVGAVSGGDTYTLPLIGEVRAWQFVFIVTGAPGLCIATLGPGFTAGFLLLET